jgi:hypothetical protein
MYSSYSCGKNVSYNICNDPWDFICSENNGLHGAGAVNSPFMGNNDKASTLKLMAYDVKEHPVITIFQDKDCKGKSGSFAASKDNKETQYYNTDYLD